MLTSLNPFHRPFPFKLLLVSIRIGLLFPFLTESLSAQEKPPVAAIESVRAFQERLAVCLGQPNFSAAALGVKVVSLTTGQTLFEHNAGKLLKPASNAKLYSGALALDRLGPDYRIKTSLYATTRPDAEGKLRGDLIVYGRGDPSFAARFNNGRYEKSLEPVADALVAAGVKRIEGDLVGDESYFRGPPLGSSWNWDDLQFYYGAEVSALTVDDNVIDLVIKPGVKLGDACGIVTSPATTFLTSINRTKTTTPGTTRKIDLYRPIGENLVFASGQLPLSGSNFIDAVAVHQPAALFVALLKDSLARRGVGVAGKLRTVNWLDREAHPQEISKLVEIGTVESRPLREILTRMMKPSQNLYAHLLLLQVAAWKESSGPPDSPNRKDGAAMLAADSQARRPTTAASADSKSLPSTEDAGLAELATFLKEAGIKKGEALLEEGSGLSRGCLVTPNATVELLRFMSRHPHAEVFRESLPIAGVDGTLRNRLKGTKAAGNVRAKTGSLRYVDTLSGYITTVGGESLAFSIMLNNYTHPTKSGRNAIDELVVMLADFSGHTSKRSE
jgi:D-alanyl-D-alanine carboxypeptidase/D-alanyl-D-alanine-endopeptidase (penicillin-binding protein 4)